jgi:hypothetical protein
MKSVRVFKRTVDDWYPSYKLDWVGRDQYLIEVSFLQLSDGQWRVCCWGSDDMGLERDYPTEAEAWAVFLQIIGWGFVNQKQLRNEFAFGPA